MEKFVDFRALQPDQMKRQSAVFIDPFADIFRINPQQGVGNKRKSAGMKSERGILRDANVFARKVPGKQSAGRRAEADDADIYLLRRELLPLLLIEKYQAAMIASDIDGFRPRQRHSDRQDNRCQ